MIDKDLPNPVALLLVEDDEVDRQAFVRQVRMQNLPYQVYCAPSGQEARRALAEHAFDVVLLDYQLGDTTGLELLPALAGIPCIFVTGMGNEEIAVSAMQQGAHDYVVKDREQHYLTVLPLVIRNVLIRGQSEKNLQESQRKLTTLMANLPGMAYRGSPGTERPMEFVSGGCSELTGFPPEYFTGEDGVPLGRLISKTERQRLADEIDAAVNLGASYQLTYRLKPRGGGSKWVLERGSAVHGKDGTLLALEGFITDITDRIEAEEALRQAWEQAESATRLKDKFVSLVAHDLRSPIGNVKVMLELVGSEPEYPLNPTQSTLMRSTLEKCDGMLHLIDELLKISRIQAGSITLKKQYILHQNLKAALHDLLMQARQKSIELNYNLPEEFRIFADPTLLREVLNNIVSNAIKFCAEGNSIEVAVPVDGGASLVIRDDGPGIKPEFVENLFRHDIKTSSTGVAGERGHGFGLPLCQDIMAAHGGRTWVESAPGAGSAFFLEFPAERPRILLLSSNGEDLAGWHGLLAQREGDLLGAASPKEALELIHQSAPHLIISGGRAFHDEEIEFMRALKTGEETSHIPMIVISEGENSGHRTAFFRSGAEDFLPKACLEEKLLPLVRGYLG